MAVKKKYTIIILFALLVALYFVFGTAKYNPEKEISNIKQHNIAKTGENLTLVVKDSKVENTQKTIDVFGEVDQNAILVKSSMASTITSVQNEGIYLHKGQPVVNLLNGVTIPMPVDGTLLNIFVNKGENISTGTDLFIAMPTTNQKTKINLELPIAYTNIVKRNMPVSILYENQKYFGNIQYISRYSSQNSGSVQVTVEGKYMNIPHNAVVKCSIMISEHKAHAVPKSAIFLFNEKTSVKIIESDGLVKTINVDVVSEKEDKFYLGGLPENIKIVIRNPLYAKDGEKYEFVTSDI